jgi:hypothetical protein
VSDPELEQVLEFGALVSVTNTQAGRASSLGLRKFSKLLKVRKAQTAQNIQIATSFLHGAYTEFGHLAFIARAI